MQIRLLTQLTEKELRDAAVLYQVAGWIDSADEAAFIERAVTGSFLAAGVFDGEKLAGFGRVLSDGVSDAYIQDVVVHPDYRRQGLGSMIVKFLVKALEDRGVDWIALVGEPGTEEFYSALGFERKDGFTLWKWKS